MLPELECRASSVQPQMKDVPPELLRLVCSWIHFFDEIMTKGRWKSIGLSHSGCYHKTAQTGWLMNDRHFSQFRGREVQDNATRILCPERIPFLPGLLTVISHK